MTYIREFGACHRMLATLLPFLFYINVFNLIFLSFTLQQNDRDIEESICDLYFLYFYFYFILTSLKTLVCYFKINHDQTTKSAPMIISNLLKELIYN